MVIFFSALIILSILSTKISAKYGIPLLIIFIIIGIVVGSDVLNLFYFDDAVLTKRIADILLVFIIFGGGFQVSKNSFKSVAGPALTLATLGVGLTALVLGLFIHFAFKINFIHSMMIASIISSTDAAAVLMLTKQNPIKSRISTTLNVESAANDPMAILLTMTFIQIMIGEIQSPTIAALHLIWQFLGGAGVGFAVYKISVFLYDHLKSENRGNYNVLLIGVILLAYGLSELAKANGIIAVFFMGYWLGNSDFIAKRGVSNFLESISTMCNLSLFLMLGLLAFPSKFIHIWKEGVIIALIMIFIARPVAIFLCTIPFKYSIKEKLFLGWGGIKGAVPIVLATYPSAYNLDENGIVFDIIFFAVFLSCIIQGSTLGILSKIFKLAEKPLPTSPYTVELHSITKSDIDMFEIHIVEDAPSANIKIADLNLGAEALITSIVRDDKIIMPKGNVKLKSHDIIYLLAHSAEIDEINLKLNVSQTCELE
ncbi:MAG: potassium/proton antiporter [Desulforegulaceae bacterium]|nr:potassium/proton antiporter [Desulforegulaceae bacterium]